MNYTKLKYGIIEGINAEINYIKKKNYWEDINSFCLYIDENGMSVYLHFNTTCHYEKIREKYCPLTCKYIPAHWYSRTLSRDEDSYLYDNVPLFETSLKLSMCSLKENFNLERHKMQTIKSCTEAMKEGIKRGIFCKQNDLLYLFMVNDCYEKKNILRWNRHLNCQMVLQDLRKWMKTEP